MIRHALKSIVQMSEAEWERAFPDEESCIEWLVAGRWPDEKRCPRCSSDLVFPASLYEYRWRCFGCAPDLGHAFDYRSGTIFEDSPHPLRLWFKALHRELTGRSESPDACEQAMRSSLHEAMGEPAFRGMVAEPGLVPLRKWEPQEAEGLDNAEQPSCPDSRHSADLLR